MNFRIKTFKANFDRQSLKLNFNLKFLMPNFDRDDAETEKRTPEFGQTLAKVERQLSELTNFLAINFFCFMMSAHCLLLITICTARCVVCGIILPVSLRSLAH